MGGEGGHAGETSGSSYNTSVWSSGEKNGTQIFNTGIQVPAKAITVNAITQKSVSLFSFYMPWIQ